MGFTHPNSVRAGVAFACAFVLSALFAASAQAAPTFAPATDYSEGAVPFGTSITTADFDADGNLDLLYEVSPAGLRLRKGDGAGGFGPFTVVPFTGGSQDFNSVFAAQLNPGVDSFPDVIVTPGGTPANDNLVLLINNGDGTFSETVLSLGAKTRAHAAAVGDLNGDGDPDIAVTTSAPAGATDNLAIFLGDGSGAFGFAGYVNHGGELEPSSPANQTDVALGYLDSDAVLDIVVANGDSENFAVLLGQGDGITFDSPVTYGTGGTEPRAIVLRDFDGDGELDFAALNRVSNDIGVRLGLGDGTFGPALTYGLGGGTGGQHLLAADFNDDGELDLVTTNQGTNDFSVLIGNGDGSFDPGVRFGTPTNPREAVAGDFDENGRPDIATTGGTFSSSTGFVSVRLNTTDEKPPNTTITAQPDDPTNDANASFSFTGSDPAIASLPLSFECRRDGIGWNPCTSPETYTAAEGARKFEVRAIDAAGNADPTPAEYEWDVDLTPPVITVTTPKAGPPHDHFELHHGSPVSVCHDPPAGAPAVSSGVADCTNTPFPDDIPLGAKQITFNATDNAGNVSAPVTRAYVIDPPNYGEFVNDDDPVAYYRFDEPYPSGATPQAITMEDSSGSGHDGTYKNNVALRRQPAISCERRPHPPRNCDFFANDPDRPGWAAFFPERDGYGYVNGIPSSPTGYTMEAWVKPRTSGPMMVMSHGRAGQLFIDANQRLAFEQSQDTVSSPGPNIPVGDWTHVAATWDGHNTRLYVNGVQAAHSTTANKTPSGTSTFYVGYGEKAPWFHGEIDEAVLYDRALGVHAFEDRYAIGTAEHEPSPVGAPIPNGLNTGLPYADPTEPKNNGLYAPGKLPLADFEDDCHDADGDADVASCTAKVDGNTILQDGTLPAGIGSHDFVVTVTDHAGNTYEHTHRYEVKDFSSLYGHDNPIAYYRLGDGPGTHMQDSSPHARHGEYKNDQDQGPVGIAGDGDTARDFRGAGGYGYANGLQAPNYQMTLEAWIEPDNWNRDQSIAGHGDGGELYLEGGVLKFRHGSQNRVVSSSPPYAPNPNSTYTQVVGTWDGVDLRIYVNGQLEGTIESNRGPTSSSTFYVGFGEIKQWFDGRIDEVAYYGTALDNNRVHQHFRADPAADGRARGNGGSGNGGGGSASGGGNGGSGGGGTADGPAKLGLRLGKSVIPAGKTAMVAVYAGDQPDSGTVAVDAGKKRLGVDRFSLDAGEDTFAEVNLSKKERKLLRKKRFVKVTVNADTGTITGRLPVGR